MSSRLIAFWQKISTREWLAAELGTYLSPYQGKQTKRDSPKRANSSTSSFLLALFRLQPRSGSVGRQFLLCSGVAVRSLRGQQCNPTARRELPRSRLRQPSVARGFLVRFDDSRSVSSEELTEPAICSAAAAIQRSPRTTACMTRSFVALSCNRRARSTNQSSPMCTRNNSITVNCPPVLKFLLAAVTSCSARRSTTKTSGRSGSAVIWLRRTSSGDVTTACPATMDVLGYARRS